jgi:tRNA(His) 5'-end guanylyltransferase
MDASASLMMEQYPDIVFGYGFSNEYRYVILFQITLCGVNKLSKRKIDSLFVLGENGTFLNGTFSSHEHKF